MSITLRVDEFLVPSYHCPVPLIKGTGLVKNE
jgi:hypothetical protein